MREDIYSRSSSPFPGRELAFPDNWISWIGNGQTFHSTDSVAPSSVDPFLSGLIWFDPAAWVPPDHWVSRVVQQYWKIPEDDTHWSPNVVPVVVLGDDDLFR